MDSNFAFSFDLPFKKLCALPDCKKVSTHVSRVTLDGNVLDFCCPQHALLGKNRWEEKKKLGIMPGESRPPANSELVEDNNIEEEGL